MTSTSAPQQGSLPNEIAQINLDNSQITQLLRTLPGLLKVSYCSSSDSSRTALSLAMGLACAITGCILSL